MSLTDEPPKYETPFMFVRLASGTPPRQAGSAPPSQLLKGYSMRLPAAVLAQVLIGATLDAAPAPASAAVVNISLTNHAITTDLPNKLGRAMPGAAMAKAMMVVI